MSKYKFSQVQDFVFKHTDAKFFDADLAIFKKHLPTSPLMPSLQAPFGPAKKVLDERMIFDLLTHADVCIEQVWEARGFVMDGSKLVEVKSYISDLIKMHYDQLLRWAMILNQPVCDEGKAEINEIRVKLPKILIDYVYKTNMMPGLQKEAMDHEPAPTNPDESAETVTESAETVTESAETVTESAETVTEPAETVTEPAASDTSTDLKAEAESKLMEADLDSLPYNEKKRLIFALKLDTDLPDQKVATLHARLSAYKTDIETKKKEVQG